MQESLYKAADNNNASYALSTSDACDATYQTCTAAECPVIATGINSLQDQEAATASAEQLSTSTDSAVPADCASLAASAAATSADSSAAALSEAFSMRNDSSTPQSLGVSSGALTEAALQSAAADLNNLQAIRLARSIRSVGSHHSSFSSVSLSSRVPSFDSRIPITSHDSSHPTLASRRPSVTDRFVLSKCASVTDNGIISTATSASVKPLLIRQSSQTNRPLHSTDAAGSADRNDSSTFTGWRLGKAGLVPVPLNQIDISSTAMAQEGTLTATEHAAGGMKMGELTSSPGSPIIAAVQSDSAAVNRQTPYAAAPVGRFGGKLWQAASSASSKMAEDFAAAKQAVQEQRSSGESLQQKMAGMVKTVSDRARPTLDEVASKTAAMGSSIAAQASAVIDQVGGFDEVDAQLAAMPIEAMTVKDAMAHALGVRPDAVQNAAAAAARTLSSWRSWGRQATQPTG